MKKRPRICIKVHEVKNMKLAIVKDPEDIYEVQKITGEKNHRIKTIVVLANDLIEAEHRLTELQQKVVFYVMGALHKSDNYFKTYRIHIPDMLTVLNLDSSTGYARILKAARFLVKEGVAIKKEKSKLTTTWFDYCEVPDDPGKGWIDVRFSEKLAPYLLDLKKGDFTILNNKGLFDMSGRYAIQLYLWIMRLWFLGKEEDVVEVEQFRTILGLNKNEELEIDKDMYKDFNKLRRGVLKPALNSINNNTECGIYVVCEEIKNGKRISGLAFRAVRNKDFGDLQDFQNAVESKKRIKKEERKENKENKEFLENCEVNANL